MWKTWRIGTEQPSIWQYWRINCTVVHRVVFFFVCFFLRFVLVDRLCCCWKFQGAFSTCFCFVLFLSPRGRILSLRCHSSDPVDVTGSRPLPSLRLLGADLCLQLQQCALWVSRGCHSKAVLCLLKPVWKDGGKNCNSAGVMRGRSAEISSNAVTVVWKVSLNYRRRCRVAELESLKTCFVVWSVRSECKVLRLANEKKKKNS